MQNADQGAKKKKEETKDKANGCFQFIIKGPILRLVALKFTTTIWERRNIAKKEVRWDEKHKEASFKQTVWLARVMKAKSKLLFYFYWKK